MIEAYAAPLLAAGIPALAFAAGLRLTSRLRLESAAIVRAALAMTAGIAVLTPMLIGAAAFGVLRLPYAGAAAWVLAAALTLSRTRKKCGSEMRFSRVDAIVAVVAALFVLIAVTGRDETLGAGRDQQVYAEYALALVRNGAPAVRYQTLDAADQALLTREYKASACHARFADRWSATRLTRTPFVVPGGTNACDGVADPVTLLHPWGWPVWLAVADAIGGVDAGYAANALVFALAGLLFAGVVGLFAAPGRVIVAMLLLFALPSSLWIAGISLSEPLAMALLMALPLLLACERRAPDLLAGAITFSAILVRIDSAIVVPIVIGAVIVHAAFHPAARMRARRVALAQCAALVVATFVYVTIFPSYLDALWAPFLAILVVSAAATVVAVAIPPRPLAALRALVDSKATIAVAVVALAGLALYAALLRPWLVSGTHAGGIEDLRQYSLLNLAANLTWPLLVAGLFGVCAALSTCWHRRAGLQYVLVTLLALGSAIPLLAFPGVTPDQPWGFRRFIPLVVPYTVLFAVVGFEIVVSTVKRAGVRAGAIGAAIVVLAFVAVLPRHAALLPENAGVTSELDAIAKALPASLTVATGDVQDVAASLLVAFGRPVATTATPTARLPDDPAIREWMAAKVAHGGHAWLLHDDTLPEAGLALSHRSSWTLRRQYVEPALRAPAERVNTERHVIMLTRVEGFDPSFATRMFGAEPVWGSVEEGFGPTQVAEFGSFRLIRGHARIEVATKSLAQSAALKIDVVNFSTSPQDVTITADGAVLWEGALAPGITTLRVPIEPTRFADRVALGVVDGSTRASSREKAGISLGLIGIRPLRRDEPIEAGSDMHDFDAVLNVVGRVIEPVAIEAGEKTSLTVDVANSGRAYWPSYREHENPAGVVKLALQWHPHGQRDVLAANDRWPLAISMLPGDRMRLAVPVSAVASDGRALPPGDYDLAITMVREGFALFPLRPEGTRWVRVHVAGRAMLSKGADARVQARGVEWRRTSASTIMPSS